MEDLILDTSSQEFPVPLSHLLKSDFNRVDLSEMNLDWQVLKYNHVF